MQILSLPEIPNWLLCSALGAVALYVYGSWPYRYWSNRGIQGPRMLPFVEGMLELARCGDFRVLVMRNLRRYGKVYGSYFMRRPLLVVADPEMAKQICIKQADCFTDRNAFGMDFRPLDKGVVMLKGQEWKRVRGLLTPTLSSGRIKAMFPLVEKCASQLCDVLLNAPDQTVDVRKSFTNFTMDVVACTLFGLEINAQVDENSDFKRHTKQVFNFDLWSWKFRAPILCPCIAKPLFKRYRISMLRVETLDFFQSVISGALRERQAAADADKYNDFLASMVKARREAEGQGVKGLTEEEVMAQSLTFLLGGLETTSTAMQFLAYFLAWNTDCQDRAYEEIVAAKERNGGVLSYECVQNLPFLNQCFDESMRMCPPAMLFDRLCTETTVVNGFEIEKGVTVHVSIYGMAHDPDVWEHPETFKPDRFDKDTTDRVRDLAHLVPFGMGPRNCTGIRLAQMEIRKAMAEMLLKVEFRPTPETKPFDQLEFQLAADLATKEPIKLMVLPRAS